MDSGLTETYLHLLAGAEFERASAPGAAPPWPGAGNVTQGGAVQRSERPRRQPRAWEMACRPVR